MSYAVPAAGVTAFRSAPWPKGRPGMGDPTG